MNTFGEGCPWFIKWKFLCLFCLHINSSPHLFTVHQATQWKQKIWFLRMLRIRYDYNYLITSHIYGSLCRDQEQSFFNKTTTNHKQATTNYQQTTTNGHPCTSNQFSHPVITRNTSNLRNILFSANFKWTVSAILLNQIANWK